MRALTVSYQGRLARSEPLDDLLPEAFATVREAAARTLGQRHFDVQVMGGAVLHLGKIAEMRTGEGKTLTATLPAYLQALSGSGVHVMTANDHLARRDAEWMEPVYRFLGLEVGLLRPSAPRDLAARRPAYGGDVTYGTWAEFAYDYLYDNMAWSSGELVQRGQHSVIIDEADLILIDEVRAAPQITGLSQEAKPGHAAFAKLAAQLRPAADYETGNQARTVSLTDSGAQAVENYFGIGDLYEEPNLPLVHYLLNALEAKEHYRRDVDYIVADGHVVIIDQASGRPDHNHTFGDGIDEAVAAKEGIEVRGERQVLGAVPMRDYLGQYERLAAMTGTAQEDAEAYRQVYQRDLLTIPANKPMIRADHADVLYKTRDSKLAALAEETAARHAIGQPVLIGAVSIEEARGISGLLDQRDVAHQVLSALNHEQEAPLIAGAGRLGAVTVVAKMAGRGVDIVLGGADGAQRERVADLGGLCVLGTERLGKRRLETHLRGRAGRQGDPGESKFFMCFDDELVKAAMGGSASFLRRLDVGDGARIATVNAVLTSIQARAAANEAAWMVQMREWDEVLAEQRRLIYVERARALRGDDMGAWSRSLIDEVVRAQVSAAVAQGHDADQLLRAMRHLYPVSLAPRAFGEGSRISDLLVDDAQRRYSQRESDLTSEVLRELERRVVLACLDREWRQHLQAMPVLLQSCTIRGWGKAALAQYRREAARLFDDMRQEVRLTIVGNLFDLEAKITRNPKPGLAD